MENMTIGGLAEKSGVGIETIRYYERRKLLEPARRKPSGYRIFDLSSVQRIRFIKNAQQLGFTLEEIRELFKLRIKKGGRCDSVKRKAKEKLTGIEEKMEALATMKKVLVELIKKCKEDQPTDDCPILKSLEQIGMKVSGGKNG